MHSPRSSERGSALLLAIIAFIIMAGVGGALFSMSVAGHKTTVNASNADVAYHVAEAGIQDTINKMRGYASDPTNANADWYAPFANMPTGTSENTVTGNVNRGSYTVTVTPVFEHDKPGTYTLRAVGNFENEWRGIEAHIDAVSSIKPFQYAMFGEVFLDATGSMFSDGYASSAGLYETQLAASLNKGLKGTPYVNATGHVGSNGGVNVGSNKAEIFGNATPGPGYSVTGNGYISGSTTAATEPFPLKPVEYTVPTGITPDSSTYPTMTTSATLGSTGSTTWYVTDSLDLKSKAVLDIQGNVTIVVKGDLKMTAQAKVNIPDGSTLTIYHEGGTFEVHGGVDATGGVDTGSRQAADFQVWSKATSATINGNSAFFGAVYAPDAEIKMNGNAGFYGGVIGKRIDAMGDLAFHYDEDLGDILIPFITIEMESSKQFIVDKVTKK